jgi:Skp family chaperone for outer membrane proteins
MRVSRVSVLIVVGVALSAAVLSHSLAQPAAKPATPTKVAVCDVVKIFNNYQRAKDLTTEVSERRKVIQSENDARGKKIDDKQKEMKALKKNSKEYESRFKELQLIILEREAWLKYQETLAVREHYRLTVEMCEEIQKMIATLAKERSIQIVLFRDAEKITSQNAAELLRQIGMRKVLYSDSSVDMTEDALWRLNEAYRASQR